MRVKSILGLMVASGCFGLVSAQTAPVPDPGANPPAREATGTQQRARVRTMDGTCDPAGQAGKRIRKGNRSGAAIGSGQTRQGTGGSQSRGRRGRS